MAKPKDGGLFDVLILNAADGSIIGAVADGADPEKARLALEGLNREMAQLARLAPPAPRITASTGSKSGSGRYTNSRGKFTKVPK